MLSAEADHSKCLKERARIQLASSQPETPGTNLEDSLKCCKPGNMTRQARQEPENNAHKDSDRPSLSSH